MTYPWWERWGSLIHRSYDAPAVKVQCALDVAAWFIETHAPDAETLGWRPVHVLRPGVGLAWRWWSMPEPHLMMSEHGLVADFGHALPFAYAAQPNGVVSILTGKSRDKALSHAV